MKNAPSNDAGPDLPPAADAARWMMGLRRDGGGALWFALLAPVVSGVALVFQAALLAQVLGRAIVHHAPPADLWPTVVMIAALMACRGAIGALSEQAGAVAGARITARLRAALLGRMLAQRPGWTGARASGALNAALVDQVEALDPFFARFLPAMVQATLLPMAFAVVVLPVDWVAGLLLLLTAPLIPVFMALAGWGAEAAKKTEACAFSRLSAHFSDRLRGLLTLKLFGREKAEIEAVHSASEALRLRTMKVLRIAFLSSAVLEFFAALGVAGVALYVGLSFLGLIDLRGNMLGLQAGLFCLLMAPEVYAPLRTLAAHYHDRAGAKAAAELILAEFAATDPAPPRAVSAPHALGPTLVQPLVLRDVVLTLPDGREILAPATCALPAATSAALIGASGAGKSSLLEAIAGLRDFGGEIALNGTPLAAMTREAICQQITLIGARPHIFEGTIADNIRLARRDASQADMRAAAERAQVMAFAAPLPGGLDTRIGDGGLGLSGGEVQRIALARAYLRDTPILLLDEPTAHLDRATERRVLDGLMDYAAGRTLIVATHSAALTARMDHILQLQDRRLTALPRATSDTAQDTALEAAS